MPAEKSYYFMEQRVAGIREIRLVGHMLCILSPIEITLHRGILSVPSELLFIILLRVMHVISKKNFSPCDADKNAITQEQGDG